MTNFSYYFHNRGVFLALLLFLTPYACDGGGSSSNEEPSYDPPIACTATDGEESPCGYIALSWDIEDGGLACTDIDAATIRMEITPAGESPREIRFDCDAGSGLTPPLVAGPYSIRTYLLSSENLSLASTSALTLALDGQEEIRNLHSSFSVENTGGFIRYDDACGSLETAFCERAAECGRSCASYGNFRNRCCDAVGQCDAISPLLQTDANVCASTLSSLSCALIDESTFSDATDFSFCDAAPPAEVDAASLGDVCSSSIACPVGNACLLVDGSEFGFCSIPCSGTDDTSTCSQGFSGAGVPACGVQVSGMIYCGVLCGQYNGGDNSCPGILECQQDTCVPPPSF